MSAARDALYAQFPRLTPYNHRITSPPAKYNCVAWLERDLNKWWEPGFFWPEGIDEPYGDEDLDAYVELFRSLGFELCDSADLEDGYLKIAVYTEGDRFHHVAKQLPSGAWSSKAGPLHDLRHDDLDVMEGVGLYRNAEATLFMRRGYDGVDPMELEETGLLMP